MPARSISAARISSGNGTEARTSSIGASISASTTENRPSVNSWSLLPSPASSQKRARTSAVSISSRGFSSTPAKMLSVAHRFTFATPRSISARPMESTSRRSPKNAELM